MWKKNPFKAIHQLKIRKQSALRAFSNKRKNSSKNKKYKLQKKIFHYQEIKVNYKKRIMKIIQGVPLHLIKASLMIAMIKWIKKMNLFRI